VLLLLLLLVAMVVMVLLLLALMLLHVALPDVRLSRKGQHMYRATAR
jgi:hypothetical protein